MKKTLFIMFLTFLSSCDGMVNSPKWAYSLAEERIRNLYIVSDVYEYHPDYVTRAARSFRVEINNRAQSNGGSYYWYLDICTVPFDASSSNLVECYQA